ncbi:MAG: O-antigen ligase family protein [Acidobacteria bacterium]|nr:O-antigen ligase family protein [Acidobacteriota bacterium]
MNALVACSLAAFGGVYLWASIPLIIACGVYAMAGRVSIARARETRVLDRLLLASVACIGLQIVPLPYAALSRLSPRAPGFYSTFLLDYAEGPDGAFPGRPLSIEPADTVYALALTSAALLLFWVCRRMFAESGVKGVIRGLAWIGLVASIVAVVQRATSPRLIYWWWEPQHPTAEPFGPFVNRNHFATWAIMVIPLTAGYILARVETRRDTSRFRHPIARLFRSISGLDVWLVAAVALMTLAVVLSRSRSGLLALSVALLAAALRTRRRLRHVGGAWLVPYLAVPLVVLAIWADPNAISERISETIAGSEPLGRMVIWRETLTVMRDFPLTGTGAGTYQTAMLLYQQSSRSNFIFNQAHNHYLQLASEGGVLVAAPVLLAFLALVRLAWRRLRTDPDGLSWIRVGALTGLAAVALQSVWETGLRMPANAILCAVVAAVAVHDPVYARRRSAESKHSG